MTPEEAARRAFRMQAEACEKLGSPFMARLCGLLGERLEARQGDVAARLLSWPGDPTHHGDAVPLRLAGGLHALVLAGAAPGLAAVYPPHHDKASNEALWAAVQAATLTHALHLGRWLDGPPQTNEVRRSGPLHLGLMAVARATGLPLRLSEIGASGGLNLNLDRYAYRYGEAVAGLSPSPLTLAPRWSGPAPETARLEVAERRGCDLAPLDATTEEGRLRLLSYLWADQGERLTLTEAALAVAKEHPVAVEPRGADSFLEERLAGWPEGQVQVVFHSIMWQYMPQAVRARCAALIEAAGEAATANRPLAWLRLEPDGQSPGAALDLTLWPGGEQRRLARADFHGRWIEVQ